MKQLKNPISFLVLLLFSPFSQAFSQAPVSYGIEFPNAVHHEAEITMTLTDKSMDTLFVKMSRSSPGRYAVHEFAKNVYNFKAADASGKALNIFRPDPYTWGITGQDGPVTVSYTLFGNRGDGTYSQIDETHAHLNMPATFMYAPAYVDEAMELKFDLTGHSDWKIATQLKKDNETTYQAPNLQYFMDSPIEVSNFEKESFEVNSNGKTYTINFTLHHQGSHEDFMTYFEQVKKVVLEEEKVFGSLPDYDFGEYTFLACYMPQASGDGMEHRNSTVITSTRALAEGGMSGNIGTVSHEFFHCWNVERIRPQSLEPFDFSQANMSGELWFAEGFTSYYTNLILCRAGIMTPDKYITGLKGTFNYVWNTPGTQFFNPIGMSYQAPFVDAATSIDPVNRHNTFISYYSYGSVLGLALDLSLRKEGLNLDDFMKEMWQEYGMKEHPYTVKNIEHTLRAYAGSPFATAFFAKYIYNSEMPDYKNLLADMGIDLSTDETAPYTGLKMNKEGMLGSVYMGSPAYNAGLESGDEILTINGASALESDILKKTKPGDHLVISYKRFGEVRNAQIKVEKDPEYTLSIAPEQTKKTDRKRSEWLKQ
ncbi:M61 family metallopeptidase [Robertkochia solimangrovi]|uniref:M61 family metallopeptidase n=1 Tax=Robertkochia solimangrovi TaxID=2213046 RepID=UPI00117E9EB4|nr:PDZ domain-containing protein [Robertkochia solimangrovi]TRZ45816.1 peptidase M61 [Robertkochia solimangrovi]